MKKRLSSRREYHRCIFLKVRDLANKRTCLNDKHRNRVCFNYYFFLCSFGTTTESSLSLFPFDLSVNSSPNLRYSHSSSDLLYSQSALLSPLRAVPSLSYLCPLPYHLKRSMRMLMPCSCVYLRCGTGIELWIPFRPLRASNSASK